MGDPYTAEEMRLIQTYPPGALPEWVTRERLLASLGVYDEEAMDELQHEIEAQAEVIENWEADAEVMLHYVAAGIGRDKAEFHYDRMVEIADRLDENYTRKADNAA